MEEKRMKYTGKSMRKYSALANPSIYKLADEDKDSL